MLMGTDAFMDAACMISNDGVKLLVALAPGESADGARSLVDMLLARGLTRGRGETRGDTDKKEVRSGEDDNTVSRSFSWMALKRGEV